MSYEATTVTSDREDIVNSIRTNLDDKRYGNKFCIIQELIQNADDAKAKRLLIGYGQLLNAPHPLLAEDGIFFVNDGILTDSDRKHLFKVATSNKASAKDKIGHFGLGMKSVFHLCEAFFMFFRQPEYQNALVNDADFLDPWYDDRDLEATPQTRQQWHNAFNENGEKLSNIVQDYLSPWVNDWPRWFCIWLPLRKQWMYNDEDNPSIINTCWTPNNIQELFSLDLSSSIAETLPFLKTLNKVTLINALNNQVIDDITINAQRRLCMQNGSLDMCLNHTASKFSPCTIQGTEKLYELQEPFTNLMQDKDWPRSTKRDRNGHFLPEKISPHVALFWARKNVRPQEHGVLTVKHCVFLPLTGEEQKYRGTVSLPFDLTLNLHAMLFVDAGRQDFAASQSPNETIQKRWNYALLSCGLLPLVIPTFEKVISTWEQEEINLTVNAFNEFLDYHDNKHPEIKYHEHITRQYQLLNCLTKNGWQWIKVSATKPFMAIPFTNDANVRSVLIQQFAIQDLLLVSNLSRGITNKESVPMDDSIFRRLRLTVDKTPTFIRYSHTFIKWLGDFIEMYPLNNAQQTQLLVTFIKQINKESYLKLQDNIFALMQYFPDTSQRLHLAKTNWDDDTFELWKKIITLDGLHVLPIIFNYEKIEWPTVYSSSEKQLISICQVESIPISDLEIIFKFISPKMTKAAQDEKRRALFKNIIFTFLNHCQDAETATSIQDYKLFAFTESDDGWDFLSLRRILSQQENIFLMGGDTPQLSKIKKAAQIKYYRCSDTDPFYTDFLKRLGIETFSFKDINRFFVSGNLPKLNSIEDRIELFKMLINSSSLESYAKIARYLLRNDPINYDSEENLYILPLEDSLEKNAAEFWNNMLKMHNEKTGRAQSKLPPTLTNLLDKNALKILHIEQLTRDKILRDLDTIEIDSELPFSVNQKTWKHLINNFNRTDRICCNASLKLPVYPINGGRFAAINTGVYFNDRKCKVPEIFADKIITCTISKDELQEIYTNANAIDTKQQVWSYAETLKYCKKESSNYTAETLAPCIRDALIELIHEASNELENDDILTFLKKQPFLESSNGLIAPAFVLNLKRETNIVTEIFQQCDLCFRSDISEQKIPTKAIRWIEENLMPSTENYYQLLGDKLSHYEQFNIGKLEINDELSYYLCQNGPARELLPAVNFIYDIDKQLDDTKSTKGQLKAFFECLSKPLDKDKMIKICNTLLEKNLERPSKAYLAYLKALSQENDFATTLLPQIKLINNNEEICCASQLIHSGEGISSSQVLHSECRNIIPTINVTAQYITEKTPGFENSCNLSYEDWKNKVENTRNELDTYFTGWDDACKCYIALLIVLCDDSQEIQTYVKQHYWDNADSTLRAQIKTKSGHSYAEKYQGTRLFIDIFNGQYIESPNLLGEKIKLTFANINDMNSLLIGDKYYSCRYDHHPVAGPCDNCKSIYLALRYLSDDERKLLGKAKLIQLLEETTRLLMKTMSADDSTINALLDTLKERKALDLEIVREMILDGLNDYLPSLGIRKESKINEILDKWHELKKNLVHAKYSNVQEEIEAREKDINEKKIELRNIVENNAQIQNDILNAVITRITEHCGYDLESIPFELFQNADDAVKEMEICETDLVRYQKMALKLTNSALTIIHYGRPINKNVSSKDNDKNAYGNQNDLEKMLKLWRSDKEIGDLKRTGKFGLGFKSVYQLTDSPLISSNSLHFSIKGTLFPIYATPAEETLLSHLSQDIREKAKYPENMPPETIIHLPFRQEITVHGYNEKKVGNKSISLRAFVDSADLLVIFSRAIKEITVIDKDQIWSFMYKKEKTINGVDIINTSTDNTFGIIHLKSGISIALRYDLLHERFIPLNKDIATIWITEPTQEHYTLDFAVNGNFAVDIGRNNLMTANETNKKISEQAGEELYQFLSAQYQTSPFNEEWLKSLWECFSGNTGGHWRLRNSSGVGTYLPNIIWGNKEIPRGYGRFISEYPVIPSNCKYTQNAYLRLKDCKYYCDDDLLKEDIWNIFKSFINEKMPNTVSRNISEALYNTLNITLNDITLTILEQWFKQNIFLTPEQSNVHPWLKIIDYFRRKGYEKELIGWVCNCDFQSQSNERRHINDLLSEGYNNSDEINFLLQFAPGDAILNSQYNNDSIALFNLAAVQEPQISIGKIVDWAQNIQNEEAIKGICGYLIHGQYSFEVAEELRKIDNLDSKIKRAAERRTGMEVTEYPIANDQINQTANTQNDSNTLKSSWENNFKTDFSDISGEGPENIRKISSEDIQWLLNNWACYKQDIITQYNQNNYHTDDLQPLPLQIEENDLNNRQRWMELFILAMCRKIGRQKDFQHFGFINKCRTMQWMKVFAAPDAPIEKKSILWMRLLDNCYTNITGAPEEYSHWIQLFPWIYHANKYLSQYISIFSRINRTSFEPQNIDDILNPSNSAMWDGANIKIPSLQYVLGHIGCYWLLRELVRSRTLTNENLYQFCFVPSKNVKMLFGDENITSKDIYKQLNNRTFDLQFDLAFKAFDKMEK